jgi:hypothetical protein
MKFTLLKALVQTIDFHKEKWWAVVAHSYVEQLIDHKEQSCSKYEKTLSPIYLEVADMQTLEDPD